MLPSVQILRGDCRESLRALPAESVQACVTSPPYWGLRAYGTDPQVWGGDPACAHEWGATMRCSCGAWRGELGSEPGVEQYLANLVAVFREVRRVLRPDGVLWVNIGDTFGRGTGRGVRLKGQSGKHSYVYDGGQAPMGANGERDGCLLLLPARFALAMQADGWLLRSEVVWHKPNAMPESVAGVRWARCQVKATKEPCPGCSRCVRHGGFVLRRGAWRPSRAHETVYMFTRERQYFWDQESSRQPYAPSTLPQAGVAYNGNGRSDYAGNGVQDPSDVKRRVVESLARNGGANLRTVWTVNAGASVRAEHYGLETAHYAAYPLGLALTALRGAVTPAGACSACGAPLAPVVEQEAMVIRRTDWGERAGSRTAPSGTMVSPPSSLTLGYRPQCACGVAPAPSLVLDPFSGTGTTGEAALRLGASYVGCELREEYAALSEARLAAVLAELHEAEERERLQPQLFDWSPT